MFRRKFLMAALVAAIAALAGPATSQAAFTLNITQTAGPGGPATTGDISTNPVFMAFGGTVGAFVIQTNTATSNASLGADAATLFATNTSIRNTAAGAATLVITVFDDTFTSPAVALKFLTTRLAGDFLSSGGLVSVQAFVDGDAGTLLSVVGTGAPINPALEIVDQVGPSGTPFTLKIVWTITLDAGQTYNGSASARAVAVPAPAGLILAATALPFAGLLRRRLRKPEATTAA